MDRKYYITEDVDIQKLRINKAEHLLIKCNKGLFGFFCVFLYLVRCRGPPLIDLRKKQIDRRKEYGKDTSKK